MGNFTSHQVPEKTDNLRNDVDSLRDYLQLMRDEQDYQQNKRPPNYDMTVFGIIVKNAGGVINTLPADKAKKLDELEADWYYVQLTDGGEIYKLKCEGANFAVGTEVRVCIPSGNYSRMYIDFKAGAASEPRFKEWVRPEHWLTPPNYKANEIWILSEGTGNITVRVQSSGMESGYYLKVYYTADANISSTRWETYHTTSSSYADVVVNYSNEKQRWLKIKADDIENIYFYEATHYGGKPAVKVLEVLVGDDVAQNLEYYPAFSFGSYIGVEHFVTPYMCSPFQNLGNLCRCECFEISKSGDTCGFNCYYFTGDIFSAPSTAKIFGSESGSGNEIFINSSIKYIDLAGVEQVSCTPNRYSHSLLEVNMPNVTTVANYAFADSYLLDKVVCPKLTTIGNQAFYGTWALHKLDIGSNDLQIGNQAFESSGISFIDNLNASTIPQRCFQNCYQLKKINNEAITTISSSAFSYCYNLRDVYVPNCTSIASGAFASCFSLRTLTVKEGCTIDANSGIDTNYTTINYV